MFKGKYVVFEERKHQIPKRALEKSASPVKLLFRALLYVNNFVWSICIFVSSDSICTNCVSNSILLYKLLT